MVNSLSILANVSSCLLTTMLLVAIRANAQTQIDLRSQAKNGSIGASPIAITNNLPSKCNLGDLLFLTSAPSGQNLYGCTSSGVWTLQSSPVPTTNGLQAYQFGTGEYVDGSTTPPTVMLNSGVIALWYSGAGAPASQCVTGRDFYTDSNTGDFYNCFPGIWKKVTASASAEMLDFGSCNRQGVPSLGRWSQDVTNGAGSDTTCDGVLNRAYVPMLASGHTMYSSTVLSPDTTRADLAIWVDAVSPSAGTVQLTVDTACATDGWSGSPAWSGAVTTGPYTFADGNRHVITFPSLNSSGCNTSGSMLLIRLRRVTPTSGTPNSGNVRVYAAWFTQKRN